MSRQRLVEPAAINRTVTPDRANVAKRVLGVVPPQLVRLAVAQALFQTSAVMMATVGALAGAQIAPAAHLATLPNSAVVLGTAVMTVPASLWMERVGRRPGFITGTLLGVLGGLIAALGLLAGSLLILAAGTFLLGTYQAFAQYYRFAAAEVVDPAYRSRAISWVLAGGVVAALLGPNLARLAAPLFGTEYVGSFIVLAMVGLLGTGTLLGLRVPQQVISSATSAAARPLAEIVRQPAFLVAVFGAATAYGVMVLAMTATPLAMVHHNHQVADAAVVIQFHVLGMFLPSFFSGSLIGRFGTFPIMLTGVALLTGHVMIAVSGTSIPSFASALLLVGVGWNFLYVGATTLLTSTYTPAERGRAQATNDMLIFGVGLLASLGSGVLLQTVGWQAMNMLLLPWLGLAALALIGLAIGQRWRATRLARAD